MKLENIFFSSFHLSHQSPGGLLMLGRCTGSVTVNEETLGVFIPISVVTRTRNSAQCNQTFYGAELFRRITICHFHFPLPFSGALFSGLKCFFCHWCRRRLCGFQGNVLLFVRPWMEILDMNHEASVVFMNTNAISAFIGVRSTLRCRCLRSFPTNSWLYAACCSHSSGCRCYFMFKLNL